MTTLTAYKIEYIKTGSGENPKFDYVTIFTSDTLKNGERINDVIGVIKCFEELAERWGTYENRHAITSITQKTI